MTGSGCWIRKNGARTFTANKRSKSSTVVFFDGGRKGDAGIDHQDIRSIPDEGARPFRQKMGTIGRAQVGGDAFGFSACLAYFLDDGSRFRDSASVVNQHMCAGLCQCRALARPMPRDAPVTRAILSVSEFISLYSRMAVQAAWVAA